MSPALRPVPSQQGARHARAAPPLISCKVAAQLSARLLPPRIDHWLPARQSALAQQSARVLQRSLRALADPLRPQQPRVLDDQALLTLAAPAPGARTSPKISRREPKIGNRLSRTVINGATKCGTNMSRTTQAISGKKIPAGRPMPSRDLSPGRLGVR